MSWTVTAGQPVPNDPYFAFNSLLLHGNGTNGSTVITDSSGSPKTVTAFGNAQISTAQSKFGGASIAFDGNGDYLQIVNNPDFDFKASPFTVEAWVYFVSVSGQQCLVTNYQNATNGWAVQLNNNRLNANLSGDGFDIYGSTVISANTWYHIALSGTPTSPGIKLFVNGVQDGSTYTDAVALNSTSALQIGVIATTAANLNGYIDDLRITKGVARYTANFTPPTAPFPDF